MLLVDPDNLHKKGRANGLSSAKGLICYLGYYQLGINGKELARYFGRIGPVFRYIPAFSLEGHQAR
jgi:hypothetical protein